MDIKLIKNGILIKATLDISDTLIIKITKDILFMI